MVHPEWFCSVAFDLGEECWGRGRDTLHEMQVHTRFCEPGL